MKAVAFGASTSKQSINKQFASYAANQFGFDELTVLDLNDYPVPLFSVDIENELGIPENVVKFFEQMTSGDIIVISLAEHNGSYTAAFKNLFDWVSRHQLKMFEGKQVILLSTAPGARGGLSVMNAALDRFVWHGGEIIGHFSLPKFHEHFDPSKGITDEKLRDEFTSFLSEVKSKILKPV